MDAGAGTVVEPDHRRADLQREVHHLVDLLGEHLAERATEHREVLAEDEHLATLDRAPPGDHTVGVRTLLEARREGSVTGQQVELVEAAGIEKDVEALAGQHLALLVLALDRTWRAGVVRLLAALSKIFELGVHRIARIARVTRNAHFGPRYFDGRDEVSRCQDSSNTTVTETLRSCMPASIGVEASAMRDSFAARAKIG